MLRKFIVTVIALSIIFPAMFAGAQPLAGAKLSLNRLIKLSVRRAFVCGEMQTLMLPLAAAGQTRQVTLNDRAAMKQLRVRVKELRKRIERAAILKISLKLSKQLKKTQTARRNLAQAIAACRGKKGSSSSASSTPPVIDFSSMSSSSEGGWSSLSYSSSSSLPPSSCLIKELCANGSDDDCDGAVDESACLADNARITGGTAFSQMADEYQAAGYPIDRIDFGYVHWSGGSGDTVDPDADLNDLDNSFGAHGGVFSGRASEVYEYSMGGVVEWSFEVPKAGSYVFSTFTWSSPSRPTKLSYFDGSQLIALPNSTNWIEMYLVKFPAGGKYSFRADHPVYLFHARLFELRQDPAAVMEPHPRLGMNDTSVADLRARASRGLGKSLGDIVLSTARHQVGEPLAYFSRTDICDPRGIERALSHLGVAYTLTGEAAIGDYGERALEGVVKLPSWHCGPSWSYLGDGEIGMGVGVAYDALAERLSPEKRKEIVRAADRHYNFTYISSIHAEHRGDGSHWWSAPSSNNWNAVVNGGGLGTGGLAFESDNRYASDWFAEAVKTQQWFLDYNFDQDGAYQESMMYNDYGMASASLLFFGAKYKGLDFMSYRGGLIHKNVVTSIYMMEPDKWNQVSFDDGSRWGLPKFPENVDPANPTYAIYRYVGAPQVQWFLAASLGNNGILQRFITQVYGHLGGSWRLHNYMGYLPRALLLYREVPEIPVSEWPLPTSRVWPEFGRAVMRSGFESSNDYMLAIQSGLFGSHGQADQSSFTVHALGRLFIDDNNYGTPATSAQNAILIDGLGQKVEGGENFGGSINSFLHAYSVDYTLADSTQGYVKNGVAIDSNLRHALLIRPQPEQDGYFIIADRVKGAVAHTYDWGVHRQPNGHRIVINNPLSATFQAVNYCMTSYCEPLPMSSLEMRFSSPGDGQLSLSGDKLSVLSSTPSADEVFAALLYPTDASHVFPPVQTVNSVSMTGFKLRNDLLLMNRGTGVVGYEGLSGDGAVNFGRSAPERELVAVFGGTSVQRGNFSCATSVSSNCVFEKEGSTYRASAGNDAVPQQSLTLTLSGIVPATYQCEIDGVSCGSITINGSVSFNLPGGGHRLGLRP